MDSNEHPPEIAIVIPYFQREPGLLHQCVTSIIDRAPQRPYKIIVVDDGSPIPAEQELCQLSSEARRHVELVKQANAGPGAARNAGLDRIPQGTTCVAFLDSDDQWTDSFLDDAMAALDLGYDLFFGNSQRIGQGQSRFEWHEDQRLNIEPSEHLLIDAQRQLYEYRGDFFDLLVRRSNIIGPTTMAYRYDRFPSVRFDTTLYNGQDRLFKLTLGQHLGGVAFSAKIYAHEGEGINIFDKSQWGTEGWLRLTSSYIELGKRILSGVNLSAEQRRYVRQQLADARRSFALGIPHQLRRGITVDWKRVMGTFRQDPMTAALLLPNLALETSRRLKRHQA
jgi:succinoglycan biosynthesis protein ExoW